MKLLKRLINAHGVSGKEEEVRRIISVNIRPNVSELSIDSLGNLVAHKKGKGPKIMLAAHMDEIGLIVKSVDSTGKMSISAIGGFESSVLVGQTVRIYTPYGKIKGVITSKEISNDEELTGLVTLNDLKIDTGLSKEELLSLGVEVGSFLVLDQQFGFLGSRDIISGKALDDRIGCYILLELAKRLKSLNQDIYYVFTTQEEVGLYGAKISAYRVEPDWAIAIDVTPANDFENKSTICIGKGPCITVKDANLIGNRCINNALKEIAKKKKIPYQLEVSESGTTDALSISLSKGGIPSTSVGVAVRNLHTTVGIASMTDIENTIKLLDGLLRNPPKTCLI